MKQLSVCVTLMTYQVTFYVALFDFENIISMTDMY